MEIIPPHRFVVGIRESMNIMCLLSTSRYSKKANSLTSFCYLPRVREKTGSAELRTRRQTQFPIIWVGLRKGQVRVAELPAPSTQARPPGQLPASWLCHATWAAVPRRVESCRIPRPRKPSGNCHWVREELVCSQGLMPHLKGNRPLSPSAPFKSSLFLLSEPRVGQVLPSSLSLPL